MAIAEDRRRLASRLTVLRVSALVAFGLLAGGFWFFQVVQHAKFQEMAENNHQRTLTLRAPRGVIFDRAGRVLVENRNSFNISIVREHTKDLDRTVRVLSSVTGLDERHVREIVDKHRREPAYRPIVIVQDATLAQVAAVTAHRLDFELPDVVVQEVPTREYPDQAMAAHLIGYVGEASEDQMSADSVGTGSIVGQSGVERVYNKLLMGEDGARRVVVNSTGREIRTLEEIAAGRRPARAALDQLLDAARGRGRVPRLRPLGVGGRARSADRRRAHAGEHAGLRSQRVCLRHRPHDVERAQQRRSCARCRTARSRGATRRARRSRSSWRRPRSKRASSRPTTQVFCPGRRHLLRPLLQVQLEGRPRLMDLRHAIEKSCNVYFYTVGNMLGIDKIHEWGVKLGLAGKSGIDLPNEIESIVPSPEWKKQRTGEKWYPGETISVSIGQGQVSVTPMSLAVMMATVANGGTRVVPRLVQAVDDGQGWQPVPAPANPFKPFLMKPETLAAVHDGLWLAVNGAGTAVRARLAGRGRVGQDGHGAGHLDPGQVAGAAATRRTCATTAGSCSSAPKDNPELAGAVFAEHAEHGYRGRAASPGTSSTPTTRRRKGGRCRVLVRAAGRRPPPVPVRAAAVTGPGAEERH